MSDGSDVRTMHLSDLSCNELHWPCTLSMPRCGSSLTNHLRSTRKTMEDWFISVHALCSESTYKGGLACQGPSAPRGFRRRSEQALPSGEQPRTCRPQLPGPACTVLKDTVIFRASTRSRPDPVSSLSSSSTAASWDGAPFASHADDR